MAILNLLDLRSIMGCPGSTRSVFTRAFWAKIELNCIFLGKNSIIITSKHDTTIFFPITIFSRKNWRKMGPKSARIYTERVNWIVLMPLEHPIILLKSNKFNMAAVSVKRSIIRLKSPTPMSETVKRSSWRYEDTGWTVHGRQRPMTHFLKDPAWLLV